MNAKRIYGTWTEAILKALEIGTQSTSLGLGPPPVARLLAIIYTAGFEAWAAYTPASKGPANAGALRRPAAERTDENKAKAVSHAIYQTALALFSPDPSKSPPDTDVEIRKILDATFARVVPAGDPTNGTSPGAIGQKAAKDSLAARSADNSNQQNGYTDTSGYVPVNARPAAAFDATYRGEITDPDHWQPLTYFDPAKERTRTPGFIAPHWGTVTPFALSNSSVFRPKPPAHWTTQSYVDQARHVIEIQRNLTFTQKVIAEFWADGPKSWLPPGHWVALALFVSERGDEKNTNFATYGIDEDAKLFFALSNAVFDASIATWEAKRWYDYVRPITAIRWLFEGHQLQAWRGPGFGIGSVPGERWTPFQKSTFPTPPFPEYTSGHSAFSMAAATVLKNFTGSDKFGGIFVQSLPLAAEPDITGLPVTLEWPTFTSAAIQAGESRLFGGIHFHEGNAEGLELGRKCGETAWTKAQSYF